jgi:hypothetical protein
VTHTRPARRDCSPAEAIAHALDDHWLTTPPGEPIYHTQAAAHVLAYLDDHGYTISAAPRPRRHGITVLDLALTIACTGAGLTSFVHGHFIWAVAALTGAALFAHEAHQHHTHQH